MNFRFLSKEAKLFLGVLLLCFHISCVTGPYEVRTFKQKQSDEICKRMIGNVLAVCRSYCAALDRVYPSHLLETGT